PGMHPFMLFGTTGSHGHLTLAVTVPRSVKFRSGRATAIVAVSAVAARWQAQVGRTLTLSDMVVSIKGGPIVGCRQIATVHVVYVPNVPVRVVLQFPHERRLSVDTRVDGLGNAVIPVRLHYVRAASPVRIGVQVSDATA